MKWFVTILAIGALACSSAMADENNLANGAFITHYVSQIQFSTDLPAEGSWWAHFEANYAVDDCAEQVTDIPGAEDGDKIWFVLAAWQEDKVFQGVEFGIDYVEGAAGYQINDHGACFPVAGLEIASGAPNPVWPAPGSGIALTVVGDDAWQGNFVPVYYFWGYTYAAGTIQITYDPGSPSGDFCGFANASQQEFVVGEDYRGAIGLNGTAGTAVCPPSDIPGACCIDGGNTCQLVLRSECTALGGHYQGDGTVCEPNPCPTTWACCVGGTCYMLTQDDCVNLFGGFWLQDDTCATVVCADMHVCCLQNNDCVMTTEAECLGLGGAYVTDPLFQSCDPNPCPVAVEETNWGAIKALYR